MKKILLLFCLVYVTAANAQYVAINDTNFVKFLQANFPSCMTGSLLDTSCAAVIAADSITCNSKSIHDLTGVQYFRNMTYLDCDRNSLTALPPLPQLTSLNCSFNQLTSATVLPAGLTTLNFGGEYCHTLPALPAGLTTLICDDDDLTALPTLPTGLQNLYCHQNSLTSLPALPASLLILITLNDPITSLPALPNGLRTLTIENNNIPTLPNHLPDSLKILSITGNPLSVIPPLPDGLTELFSQFNRITSLPTPLPSHLTQMVVTGYPLHTLPPLPRSLTYLWCFGDSLTSLPELPDSLYDLDVSGNDNLTCLPELKRIVSLNFSNTAITCVPDYGQVTSSTPSIGSLPLCAFSNSHGCPTYWNITGSVYFDANGDCIQQGPEPNLLYTKVNLYQGGSLLQQGYFSNDYSFDPGLGTYTVAVDTTDFPFYISCPVSGDSTVNVTNSDSMLTGINFAAQCKPGYDMGVRSIYDWYWFGFFPGFTTPVVVVAGDMTKLIHNAGCNSSGLGGQVQVVISGPAKFYSNNLPGLVPSSVSADSETITWNVTDFSSIDPATAFQFNVYTDTGFATLGQQICITATVADAGDANPSNNTLTHCFVAGFSFDPNEMEVSPVGDEPYPFNDWLTYTLHYQNTGTAAAHNIAISDTLDAHLDAATFQLLAANPMPVTQVLGNNIQFHLPSVNLPDSGNNFTGSQGFIQYRIKPLINVAAGTTLKNNASIYFDFNAGVGTNTTLNTITGTSAVKDVAPTISESLRVFPNPASNQLFISVTGFTPQSTAVYDLNGRKLHEGIFTKQLDVNYLSPGVYFIEVKGETNMLRSMFIKM